MEVSDTVSISRKRDHNIGNCLGPYGRKLLGVVAALHWKSAGATLLQVAPA